MGYRPPYDALCAAWAKLDGTTAEKLAALNTMKVAGPAVDVPVGQVVYYLALRGKFSIMQDYASGKIAGSSAEARTAARELLTLLTTPGIAALRLSDPITADAIDAFLAVLVADGASGVTAADRTALLAFGQTTLTWWRANGYGGPMTERDLCAARLISKTEAWGVKAS
ncbi:MAG: hypothetical protein ACHQRJ_03735 [Alphaproteobacteria bacterium]